MNRIHTVWLVLLLLCDGGTERARAAGAELSSRDVRAAIERGREYLSRSQRSDGSFPADGILTQPLDATCLSTLALLQADQPPQSASVQRSWKFLRSVVRDNLSTQDLALLVLTFSASAEPADRELVATLAGRLVASQLPSGDWPVQVGSEQPHPPSSQFALLGLKAAANAGAEIPDHTWQRAGQAWLDRQLADGSWRDAVLVLDREENLRSASGQTQAGLNALLLCREQMERRSLSAISCCQPAIADSAVERGLAWLQATQASTGRLPPPADFATYYLYGLQGADRINGQWFHGERDWFREGASRLLARQNARTGEWPGNNPVMATSYALLFLTRGIDPVVVTRLRHGPRRQDAPDRLLREDWRGRPRDLLSLTEFLVHRPGWPRSLTTQELDLSGTESAATDALRQSPLLLITGSEAPEFTATEVVRIREYLAGGGCLIGSPACGSVAFEQGFRKLAEQVLPTGSGTLNLLPPDHPVYHAEFAIDATAVQFYGSDTGCRTAVFFCPQDLCCGWSLAHRTALLQQEPKLATDSRRALEAGTNLVAYVTGREPPARLEEPRVPSSLPPLEAGSRGGLTLAAVRHDGGWNTAPRSLHHLAAAVSRTADLPALRPVAISLADAELYRHPLLLLHGRRELRLTPPELSALREHLQRGGLLFADACCGSPEFDRSFRQLCQELFPQRPLEKVSADHELMSERIGSDLSRVRRRRAVSAGGGMEIAAPQLEGIAMDGRYLLLYSPHDVSCALDSTVDAGCPGYVREDAVRLAVNVVLYSLLQDVRSTAGLP